jgi:EmrB/QacA subfamily drug resistance transporter
VSDTGIRPGSDSYVRTVSLVVLIGSVGPMLETTITSVAIGTLADHFRAPVSSIQWVSTAYLLALAMIIPLTGWLVERFGARRTWAAALWIFTIASVLCGAAWSTSSLIAFRVLQGLGGGLTLPLAQTFIAQASGPQRFGRALAFVAIPAQLAPVVGPVVGGFLVADLGWRWIFWINVPLQLVGLALARRRLPETGAAARVRLDVTGLLLLSPGLALLLYGLSEASIGAGSAAPVALPLTAGALLLAAYGYHALHTARDPLIDLRLFRDKTFAAATATTFLVGLSLFGAMFLLPLFQQRARGHGVVAAGLLLAPQGLGALVALLVSTRAAERVGARRVVLTGLLLTVLGTLVWGYVGDRPGDVLLEAALLVRGAGIATAGVPAMAAAYLYLTQGAIPRATAALYSLQRLGGSVGTAALAVILQGRLSHAVGDGQVAAAFGWTFRWSAAMTGLAFVPALLLPSGRQHRSALHAPAADTLPTVAAPRPLPVAEV